MLRLLSQTTVQRMIERDDFSKRIQSGTPIYLHECLYPLMQGWDSVEIHADVELGGTEQLYNLMVGRDLQRTAGQPPQICLTMPILRGLDGVKKMGKSLGNYIGLNEPAKEQFGKTMRIPDDLMTEWYTLLTDRSAEEIARIVAGHPNEAKKLLAGDIVAFYHGKEAAAATLADWNKQFSGGGKQDPDNIDEVTIPAEKLTAGGMTAVDLLVETKLCASKSEARRMIVGDPKNPKANAAVNFGPERTQVKDVNAVLPVTDGLVLRAGRKIVRVKAG
jgi:tyrosyl-tRNA synthetase